MSELTKAHIKFLKEIGTITKSETNDFHNSKYASLEGVLSVVIPVLIKNEIVLLQYCKRKDIKESWVFVLIRNINLKLIQ